MYGHTCSKNMDQPGKVANSYRGQLIREHYISLTALLVRSGECIPKVEGMGNVVLREEICC